MKYGLLIAINRYMKNLSIRVMSDDTEIDIGTLSRIENEQLISLEKVKIVLENLDISVDTADEAMLETSKAIKSIVHSVIYVSDSEIIQFQIKQLNEKYWDKCFTVDLLLINLLAFVLYKVENDIDMIIYTLEQVNSKMSEYQKCIFYLFLGMYKRNNSEVKKAIELMELSSNYITEKELYAYVLYHLSMVYYSNAKFIESLLTLQKAELMFKETNNLYRVANSNQLISSVMAALGYYESSIEISKSVIEMYKKLNVSKKEISSVIYNRLNALFLNGKYNCFFEEINLLDSEILNLLNNNERYLIDRILALFFLGDFTKCIEEINIYIDKIHDNIYMLIIKYLEYTIHKKSNAIKYLKQALKEMKITGKMFNYELLLKLLINELLANKQYKEACKYYRLLCK